MIESFRPVNGEYPGIPKALRYRTSSGSRVTVQLGTEFGYPAVRCLVRDGRGREKKGGNVAISLATTHEQALEAYFQDSRMSRRGVMLLQHLSRQSTR